MTLNGVMAVLPQSPRPSVAEFILYFVYDVVDADVDINLARYLIS